RRSGVGRERVPGRRSTCLAPRATRFNQNTASALMNYVNEDRMPNDGVGLLVLEPLIKVMVREHDALQVGGTDRIDAGRRMQQDPQVLGCREHMARIRY